MMPHICLFILPKKSWNWFKFFKKLYSRMEINVQLEFLVIASTHIIYRREFFNQLKHNFINCNTKK